MTFRPFVRAHSGERGGAFFSWAAGALGPRIPAVSSRVRRRFPIRRPISARRYFVFAPTSHLRTMLHDTIEDTPRSVAPEEAMPGVVRVHGPGGSRLYAVPVRGASSLGRKMGPLYLDDVTPSRPGNVRGLLGAVRQCAHRWSARAVGSCTRSIRRRRCRVIRWCNVQRRNPPSPARSSSAR